MEKSLGHSTKCIVKYIFGHEQVLLYWRVFEKRLKTMVMPLPQIAIATIVNVDNILCTKNSLWGINY